MATTAPARLARLRASLAWRPPLSRLELLAAFLLLVTAISGVYNLYWLGKHALAVRRLTRGVGGTTFASADGRPWFALDERRYDVPLDEVSPFLRDAVVAIEDHRFYRHFGIDPLGLARAALRNIRTRRVLEGGSTITQQLARTLFLSNRRTVGRKAKEAVLALMLEAALSKQQILELYLNRVYLSGGVFGVEAMSRSLYGKRARELTLAEAALIAAVIQAPSALSPWSNFDAALARSRLVLSRMRRQGYVSEAAERSARRASLRITDRPARVGSAGGYAKEYLRQLFREHVGEDNPPDWQVHTTFLPALQHAAEQALARGLRGLRVEGLQGALVALDPQTGDLLALVGGADFAMSTYNRAVRSHRQPGSAFKPFVYAAALEKGYSPVSILTDLRSVHASRPDEWRPRNVSDDGPDEETLREALLTSNNQAAVALQRQVGSRAVLQVAGRAGLRQLPDVPSLALGTGLVTPLELTAAFAVFANGGFSVRPRAIVKIVEPDGAIAYAAPYPERARVLRATVAFQVSSMLRDVAERGTGSAARVLGFPVAGKTGTTDDFKDAWFVGYSSEIVAGVWVGFDQPATIRDDAFGARVALPIWIEFMRRAARLGPPDEFEVPAGLREVDLCQVSYQRALLECPSYVEYLKEGDPEPRQTCRLHRGTLKHRVERAVEGLLDKLRDIFR
jgi:penicillin-binding protein 1A